MKNLLIILAVIAVLGVAYTVMGPDRRSTGEKIGDAVHELPNGIGKASDELSNDRTPGQKLGDTVRHTGDKIKANSDSQ